MNKIKMRHIITGQVILVRIRAGISKEVNTKTGLLQKTCADLNATLNHYNSRGFVRCGKSQELNDVERKMIETAPEMIKQANAIAATEVTKRTEAAARSAMAVINARRAASPETLAQGEEKL